MKGNAVISEAVVVLVNDLVYYVRVGYAGDIKAHESSE
jgi:hypothetical protein